MLRSITIGCIFLLLSSMIGCTTIRKFATPGVAYPLKDEGYEAIIAKAYEVVQPLILASSSMESLWVESLVLRIPVERMDPRKFREVPAGAKFYVRHVSRKDSWFGRTQYYFMGEFLTLGLSDKRFVISQELMEFNNQGQTFNESFMGMNPRYLKEIQP